jgi:hypothetical protein
MHGGAFGHREIDAVVLREAADHVAAQRPAEFRRAGLRPTLFFCRARLKKASASLADRVKVLQLHQ